MGLPQITFVGYWRRTRMFLPIGCSKKLPPRRGYQICTTKKLVLELCGDKFSWYIDMRKVKATQGRRWPLTHKGIMSLLGLANYYHHFILGFYF